MLKKFEILIMVPIALIGLLVITIIDLIRTVLAKPTIDEEWQDIHVDSNMNHGQGPFKEEN